MSTGLELFALCKDGSERRINIGLRPVQRGLQNLVIATIQLRETDARMPSANSGAAQDEAPGGYLGVTRAAAQEIALLLARR